MSIFPILLFVATVLALLLLSWRKRQLDDVENSYLANVFHGVTRGLCATHYHLATLAKATESQIPGQEVDRHPLTQRGKAKKSDVPNRPVDILKQIEHQKALVRLIMQPLISLILLIAALLIVFSDKFSPSEKHWAYGTIGTVIGFWLKG